MLEFEAAFNIHIISGRFAIPELSDPTTFAILKALPLLSFFQCPSASVALLYIGTAEVAEGIPRRLKLKKEDERSPTRDIHFIPFSLTF